MQIAKVWTSREDLRCSIDGWTFEDSSLFVRKAAPHGVNPNKIFIGYTPSPNLPSYGTVLEMLADGWTLLGPPGAMVMKGNPNILVDGYHWWLTRTI